jgi:hypothetical protein
MQVLFLIFLNFFDFHRYDPRHAFKMGKIMQVFVFQAMTHAA